MTALKTIEEQPKWDGKATEKTNIGWQVHGKDTAVDILARWNDTQKKPEIQIKMKKSNNVDITLHFLSEKSDKLEDLRVYKIVAKSPYEEEPREILKEEDRCDANSAISLTKSGYAGTLTSKKTGKTFELGDLVKITEEKLVPHSITTSVFKEEHDRLITTEVSLNSDLSPTKIHIKVEENGGKVGVNPLIQGVKTSVSPTINSVQRAALVKAGFPVMIREGNSDGEPKVLVDEIIDTNSLAKKLAEFLKEPGVVERAEKIAKENRDDQEKAVEFRNKGWDIKQE